jgi:hypothetical protein
VEDFVLRFEDAPHAAVSDEAEQLVLVVDQLADLRAHRLLRPYFI